MSVHGALLYNVQKEFLNTVIRTVMFEISVNSNKNKTCFLRDIFYIYIYIYIYLFIFCFHCFCLFPFLKEKKTKTKQTKQNNIYIYIYIFIYLFIYLKQIFCIKNISPKEIFYKNTLSYRKKSCK